MTLYLSPHLDDVVLSCGGHIWQQTQAGIAVSVVTVFAAAPAADLPISPLARSLHVRWGHPQDAVVRRQQEDRRALGTLGAQALHWPYLDCIYRRASSGRYLYADEDALWGAIAPEETGLIATLAERIVALVQAYDPNGALRVYAPLAIGRHVDHRIVRQAAERAGATWGEAPLYYYEDYPYAEDDQAVRCAQRHPAGSMWRAIHIPLSPAALAAKVTAIACYRSQISSFWKDTTEMATAIRAFARQVGDGGPTERYWVREARGA